MNCEEARQWLSAYVDEELDVTASLEVERHLAECPGCRREHAELLGIREAMRGAELTYEPPAALAKKVRAEVARAARQERGAGWFDWRWAAAAALAAAVLVAAVLWTRPSGAEPRLLAEVVAGHVRSLQADHLVDVESSDRHTVKPWFQGRLDFSPPVPDLPELVGGRLDYLDGRAVAALIYQRRGHRINVFVWPGAGQGGPTTESTKGYQAVHWYGAGMEWWAVSDMNAVELTAFAKGISGNISPVR